MKHLLLAALMASSLIACKGKNYQEKAEQLLTRANAAFDNDSSTAEFKLVKLGKDGKNWAVYESLVNSPFGPQGTLFAVNLNTVDLRKTSLGILTDAVVYVGLNEIDSTGNYECGVACFPLTNEGTIRDFVINGSPTLVFENTVASVKDLEKAAAFVEAAVVDSQSKKIAAEFGLSEERSMRVASLAQSWKKLSKSRAVTESDANAFTKELTGMNMSSIENAYTSAAEGSSAQLNQVFERAAEVNGTTPENMAEIMSRLFN